MKIDGMDAANLNYSKQQDATSQVNESNNLTEHNSEPATSKDGKSISQLTNFERKELPVSERVVIDAIEKANKAISGINTKFEFSIHKKTKEIMVKVIDSDTNQVIREIPPEKMLDLVAKIWEMAGILVDERR